MADHTKIEWTEATWNPITGCTVHSPGCTNCYAMQLAGTRLQHIPSRAGLTKPSKAGPVWTGEVRFNEEWLTQPLRWKRPRMIFVCAHGDLFHEKVPDEWIDRIFAVMALCPQHTFQVLTKRSDRMREYLASWQPWVDPRGRVLSAEKLAWKREIASGPRQPSYVTKGGVSPDLRPKGSPLIHFHETGWPLPNVWLGVSVEDQTRADQRIPDLLATPAAVRWISAEPLLGPVDLTPEADKTYQMLSEWYGPNGFDETGSQPRLTRMKGWFPKLDWVVVGGESGKSARPMHPDWARSLRDQCAAANVPFFFKQWGEWGPDCGPLATTHPGSTIKRDPIMEGQARCAVLIDGSWQHFSDGYEPSIELCSAPSEFVYRLGKGRNGRLLDGIEHNGFPDQPHA